MKTTIVPAQVTSVEDKIAGNLNFTQVLLLTTPVFLSGAVFALLPPFMSLRSYKLALCVLMASVCIVLSIRIKGRIILAWIAIIGRYNLRPRYYIFNKNDLYLRPIFKSTPTNIKRAKVQEPKPKLTELIPLTSLIHAEHMADDPRARFEFRTNRKGELRVHIQEIK